MYNPAAQKRHSLSDPDEAFVANLYGLDLLSPSKRVKWQTYSDTKSPPRNPPNNKHSPQSAPSHSALRPERGSTGPRLKRGMTGMLDIDRSYHRRERTFAGTACIVCEEPLEHTLRGEKILQLSCAHVTHEACFYEYIREFDFQACPGCNRPLGLDSSRGGNVLDIDKLGAIVRALQLEKPRHSVAEGHNSAIPWNLPSQHPGPDHLGRPEASPRNHVRNSSNVTDGTSGGESGGRTNGIRHHGDDHAQVLEDTTSTPRYRPVNSSINPPTVSIRSEYPTLNRSRHQQSLTCLITVEVLSQRDSVALTESYPNTLVPQGQKRKQPPLQEAINGPDGDLTSSEELDQMTEDLHTRVDNWHGLDFSGFGKLYLHSTLQVGKDRQSWQELECYLFSEMLICVKEKKSVQQADWDPEFETKVKGKCTLKGSIMIKKHLEGIESFHDDEPILTLHLSVPELPSFHLQFPNRAQLETWKRALVALNKAVSSGKISQHDQDNSGTEEDDERDQGKGRSSSAGSSYGASRSHNTAPTEYSENRPGASHETPVMSSLHVPLDIVMVIPLSSSMHGLKISLLRDMIRFSVSSLGEKDRMGLVTFGSSGGASALVGLTSKAWSGWAKVIETIRPIGQKSLRADLVEGANVAMDLLIQRNHANPLSSVLLVSDSSTSDSESIDFVVSRAEAARVAIYCFGLGLAHKVDTMIELSTRTKASYTYVKDWMMLRECVAGCLGSLQSISHQNVKLKLRLPAGSPAKFAKISGPLHIAKRAAGRDAEAALGDLRFGDKRDVLVQLVIAPETPASELVPQDAWESIVSGLEALGGPSDSDDSRALSIEEVPILQADLVYNDILRDGAVTHLPRPSLLAITMLPATPKPKATATSQSPTPPTTSIPPHPLVVQRRMELLTSDMLTRALTLVTRNQQDRAHHILNETRSILKGLGKGGLPPLPPQRGSARSHAPSSSQGTHATSMTALEDPDRQSPSPLLNSSLTPAAGIDQTVMSALDAELESSLEWINHPAVFGRDSRKAVLQTIGAISSQRAYTFRTPLESLWAGRISGIRRVNDASKAWREADDESLAEES